jgi:(1->4)-alpha-D-glucan 1-alpha-D-glucosylmutase
LRLRAEHADLFTNESYESVQIAGEHRERCVAFRRRLGSSEILVAAPRLTVPLGFPPLGKVWADTKLTAMNGRYRNVFTGAIINQFDLATLLAEFPVGLLVKEN